MPAPQAAEERFMTTEHRSKPASDPPLSRIRLRVAAEADPSVLPRILAHLQNLNLSPRRLLAESGSGQLLHVQVDFAGESEELISRLCGKLSQGIHVLNVFWHHL
jgi:hypothetical protein